MRSIGELRRVAVLAALLLVVTAACSKAKKSEGGGGGGEGGGGGGGAGATPIDKTPEDAIKRFVAALVKGDLEAAKKQLPDEKTCELFPDSQHKAACVKSVPRLREGLAAMAAEVKDFKLGAIVPAREVPSGAPPNVKFFDVSPEGEPDDTETIFVVDQGGGDWRVAYPIMTKEATPDPPPEPPVG